MSNHDLAISWTSNQIPSRNSRKAPGDKGDAYDGPVTSYVDRENHDRFVESIWGPPEPLPKPKTSQIRRKGRDAPK